MDQYFRNYSLLKQKVVNWAWRFLIPFSFESRSGGRTCTQKFRFWHNKHWTFFQMRPKTNIKLKQVESYALKTMKVFYWNRSAHFLNASFLFFSIRHIGLGLWNLIVNLLVDISVHQFHLFGRTSIIFISIFTLYTSAISRSTWN